MSETASLSSSTKTPIAKRTARTTVALPVELRERLRIDTEFQAMASDTEYQREFRQIQAEFAAADRETLPGDESAAPDATKR